MRRNIIKIICILIVFLSVIFTGCSNSNPEQIEKMIESETLQGEENTSVTIDTNSSEKGFQEITVDEAYKIFISDKDYLFIDVRSKESYDKSHVKDAINIPVAEIKKNLDKIPKNKIIIVYCSGTGCNISSAAAEVLVQNGFTQVYKMGGLGINEWIEKDYPVE
ncbi:MAG: rhodanese-like domain-containing protein [Cyanobacteria bacterium]|nr:rhodanese-like domain-containing protein [Cyanobacteriota bacterium]